MSTAVATRPSDSSARRSKSSKRKSGKSTKDETTIPAPSSTAASGEGSSKPAIDVQKALATLAKKLGQQQTYSQLTSKGFTSKFHDKDTLDWTMSQLKTTWTDLFGEKNQPSVFSKVPDWDDTRTGNVDTEVKSLISGLTDTARDKKSMIQTYDKMTRGAVQNKLRTMLKLENQRVRSSIERKSSKGKSRTSDSKSVVTSEAPSSAQTAPSPTTKNGSNESVFSDESLATGKRKATKEERAKAAKKANERDRVHDAQSRATDTSKRSITLGTEIGPTGTSTSPSTQKSNLKQHLPSAADLKSMLNKTDTAAGSTTDTAPGTTAAPSTNVAPPSTVGDKTHLLSPELKRLVNSVGTTATEGLKRQYLASGGTESGWATKQAEAASTFDREKWNSTAKSIGDKWTQIRSEMASRLSTAVEENGTEGGKMRRVFEMMPDGETAMLTVEYGGAGGAKETFVTTEKQPVGLSKFMMDAMKTSIAPSSRSNLPTTNRSTRPPTTRTNTSNRLRKPKPANKGFLSSAASSIGSGLGSTLRTGAGLVSSAASATGTAGWDFGKALVNSTVTAPSQLPSAMRTGGTTGNSYWQSNSQFGQSNHPTSAWVM